MAMTSAARWGLTAGCLVLLGGACGGAVVWQAHTFDAVFADLSKKLSDESHRQGVLLIAEETGRRWNARDIAVRFHADNVDLRWSGQATFGLGTKAVLTLDTDYGTAAMFESAGISGYQDRLTLRSGWGLSDAEWSWEAVPFRVLNHETVLADVGAMKIDGATDMTTVRFHLTGVTIADNGLRIVSGPVKATFTAQEDNLRNSSVKWTLDSLKMQGNGVNAELGLSSLSVETTVTGKKEEDDVLRLDYAMNLGSLLEDGERLWDAWNLRVEVHEVPEVLFNALADMTPENGFGTLVYLQYAFHREGLKIRIPVNEWCLGDAKVSVTGQLVDDGEGLGRFEVVIDKAFVDKAPQLRPDTDAWLREGLLLNDKDRLLGHGYIDPQARFYLNGKPL